MDTVLLYFGLWILVGYLVGPTLQILYDKLWYQDGVVDTDRPQVLFYFLCTLIWPIVVGYMFCDLLKILKANQKVKRQKEPPKKTRLFRFNVYLANVLAKKFFVHRSKTAYDVWGIEKLTNEKGE